MRGGTGALVIPSIVLAELKHLAERGRVEMTLGTVIAAIRSDTRASVYPLDERVVELMPSGLEIHDAIICATALIYRNLFAEEVRVVTRDEGIARAGIVETLW
jgi:predicted nucleic acid-binding protein